MRILITNVYSYKNKGDAAIVLALVQEIQRTFNNPEIIIQTADSQHDTDKYGTPVTESLLWTLLSRVRTRSLLVRLWVPCAGILTLICYCLCFRLFGKGPKFILTDELKQFVTQNLNSDLVIACGGGYLRTPNSSLRETILLTVTCLNFLIAKFLSKPVYLYSQSVGPVNGRLQTRILRTSLNRVDLVEPREDISLEYLRKLNVRAKIIKTADPALLLDNNGKFPSELAHLKSNRLHVGLTVRKWFDDPKDFARYLMAVAQTIDYLVEEHNAEVLYIPQVIAETFGDDDRIVARQVWARVKNKKYFTVIEADLHPFEIIGLCGKMDIFVGTRMHSNIFALISHVPVVAIEYEHKTKGIMRGLGLENLTIDIRQVTFALLKRKINLLIKNHNHYKKLITNNLPKQIEQSRRAIEVISESYTAKVTK